MHQNSIFIGIFYFVKNFAVKNITLIFVTIIFFAWFFFNALLPLAFHLLFLFDLSLNYKIISTRIHIHEKRGQMVGWLSNLPRPLRKSVSLLSILFRRRISCTCHMHAAVLLPFSTSRHEVHRLTAWTTAMGFLMDQGDRRGVANHFVGIEGGGTSSKGALLDGAGNVLSRCVGGCTNQWVCGMKNSCETIAGMVKELRKSAKIPEEIQVKIHEIVLVKLEVHNRTRLGFKSICWYVSTFYKISPNPSQFVF